MRIQINPRSLLNLENICEVLYKLHPSVLDFLVKMERSLGGVLGKINLENLSEEEREFLSYNFKEKDYSMEEEELKDEDLSEKIKEMKENENEYIFSELRKYIQLDTDEYIPMKIYVEVEDPVTGRKVKELVEALEKTRAPEQFYLNKKELDEDAYFAEGYGLSMNKEQKKELDDFLDKEDVVELKKLLKEKHLYP